MNKATIIKLFHTALALAVAGCICLMTVLSVLMLTFAEGNYIEKQFASQSVTEELSQELYAKLDVISDSAGLPYEVLRSALPISYVSSFQQFVLSSAYRQRNYSISNSIDIESVCRRALDEYYASQGKKPSDAELDKITGEVSCEVDEVYKIKNIDELSVFISVLSGRRLTKLVAMLAIAGTVLSSIIYFTNSKRKSVFLYYAEAFISAGGVLVVTGAYFKLSGFVARLSPTNVNAYNNAIANTSTVFCLALANAGVLFVAIGAAMTMQNYKYYSSKLKRIDAELRLENDLI